MKSFPKQKPNHSLHSWSHLHFSRLLLRHKNLKPLLFPQNRRLQNFQIFLNMPISLLPHERTSKRRRRYRSHQLQMLGPVVAAVQLIRRKGDIDKGTGQEGAWRQDGDFVVLGTLQQRGLRLVFLGECLWHHYVYLGDCKIGIGTGIWRNLKPWPVPATF